MPRTSPVQTRADGNERRRKVVAAEPESQVIAGHPDDWVLNDRRHDRVAPYPRSRAVGLNLTREPQSHTRSASRRSSAEMPDSKVRSTLRKRSFTPADAPPEHTRIVVPRRRRKRRLADADRLQPHELGAGLRVQVQPVDEVRLLVRFLRRRAGVFPSAREAPRKLRSSGDASPARARGRRKEKPSLHNDGQWRVMIWILADQPSFDEQLAGTFVLALTGHVHPSRSPDAAGLPPPSDARMDLPPSWLRCGHGCPLADISCNALGTSGPSVCAAGRAREVRLDGPFSARHTRRHVSPSTASTTFGRSMPFDRALALASISQFGRRDIRAGAP